MKNSSYIKSLDGLRAVAVLMVVFDHWSGDRLGFPASYLGVCMFFVLSGFLITGIILTSKLNDDAALRNHWGSIKLFFIRRTIRIFPLYYLVLFVLFLVNVPVVRANIIPLGTYMTNNYIAYQGKWLGQVDHLWSLAVEEQFYVFFPFFIFFISQKYIKTSLIVMIFLAVGVRLYFFVTHDTWIRSYILMPACLDAFGLGGLLAYWYKFDKKIITKSLNSYGLILSTFAYIGIIALIKLDEGDQNFYGMVLLRLFESLFSVFLISNLISTTSNVFLSVKKAIFENSLMVYLGKISYGIYIFHNLIFNPYHSQPQDFISKVFLKLDLIQMGLSENPVARILVLFPFLVLLASMSWFLFEKPINKLKDRFSY